MCDDRRPPLTAADHYLEAALTGAVLAHLKPDIVKPDGGAVMRRSGHRDLEFARQEREFGMKGRPLADQFRIDSRILKLVVCGAGIGVGSGVADHVAAGLDSVHLDRCQLGEQVRDIRQFGPVILDVLPGGEMAIAPVETPRDIGQLVHLATGQRAVGNGDPQHIGMKLKIEPVHQPQRPKLFLR